MNDFHEWEDRESEVEDLGGCIEFIVKALKVVEFIFYAALAVIIVALLIRGCNHLQVINH